ncbi:transcriptional regulator BolA [Enterovibrio norvegicus]|uniref:DNA-binding transcriptional regulator BolA n=2 Tax=Enterovibrio norvegicus TaxID=188144 RepID=A0A1I5QPP1_9GAMM|nr:transcriptional regulator BolA [Enterovibrio norvegicus]MCC4799955.1 transcriptional regulator BolA [Enterovibrio norvegicus]OEE44429.1 transcriptional regulator BolA [Enterovibrio norvegicus]OEF54997.1 transcriptional regulator BolA [Enterovibrio norvegicus]OEF65114.1 transcriptional regulator BolA [Enterovibrio norvegicus]PMH61849.1 transcriptional regulator BolA [Enterovibrio norvegicus]
MVVQQKIEQKLAAAFSPVFLDVINESHMHNVPAGSESHFKVTVVTQGFEGKRLLARHRSVNQVLADELKNDIHALAIHTYTESEWHELNGQSPVSPPCHGGSNLDS